MTRGGRLFGGGSLGLAATLAVAVLAAAAPGGSAGATGSPPPLPPDFAGMYAAKGDVIVTSDARRAKVMRDAHAAGVELMREPFDWAVMERSDGQLDWTPYDQLMTQAALNRIRILPILQVPPTSRTTKPADETRRGKWPPKSYPEFAAWAAKVVARYKPGGTFWRSNPSLPQDPIHSWQVWNEPNIPYFWGRTTNAAEYTQLLRTTSAAIHQVDPDAEVVTAGLAFSDLGPLAPQFLEDMYKAGAKGTFDTVAVHPYADSPGAEIGRLESVRQVLAAHGDAAPIWPTEFGWATGGETDGHGDRIWSEDEQAALVHGTLAAFGEQRVRLGIRGFVYFYWSETGKQADYTTSASFWGHMGLLRKGDFPKPAYFAFVDAVRGLGPLASDAPGGQPRQLLSSLHLRPARFAAAVGGPTVASRGAHAACSRRVKHCGSRILFRAQVRARVRVAVERLGAAGRRPGRGGFTVHARRGRNSFRLSGRLGGRALRPGHYVVRLRALGWAAPAIGATFRIVRG